MNRRELIAIIGGAPVLVSVASLAQQPKVPTIGVLVLANVDSEFVPVRVFQQGLRDLGYVEGQNIRFEIRSAEAVVQRLPELAAELVRRKVDVIVPWSASAVLAAKQATSEIPIVMMGVSDPVGLGLVATYARPGDNITGAAVGTAELGGKHVELLKEALPGLSRIAALCNVSDPSSKLFLEQVQLAGKAHQVEIAPFLVTAGAELHAAFPAMVGKKINAVIVHPILPQKEIADLAIRHHLPTGSPSEVFPKNGGLMGYAQDNQHFYRISAVLVDKILKGAKPADLPVEQPTRFRLVINLKTAKALGLTVPATLLARADEVIE